MRCDYAFVTTPLFSTGVVWQIGPSGCMHHLYFDCSCHVEWNAVCVRKHSLCNISFDEVCGWGQCCWCELWAEVTEYLCLHPLPHLLPTVVDALWQIRINRYITAKGEKLYIKKGNMLQHNAWWLGDWRHQDSSQADEGSDVHRHKDQMR